MSKIVGNSQHPHPQTIHTHTHTENKTRWTQHDTDTRLVNRIGDVTNWKDTLTRTLTDTEKEIEKVSYCNIVYSTMHCTVHQQL